MLARNPTSESSAVALALPGLADSTRLVLTARFRAAQGKGIASIIEMGLKAKPASSASLADYSSMAGSASRMAHSPHGCTSCWRRKSN
jgi:hypothetical protein